jgi:YmgG-like glycine-zipper protein
MSTKQIQAAVLSLALLVPAESAFARTHHLRHHRRATAQVSTSSRPHHYSQTRGALIGAAVGAAVGHRHPLKGALIGGALGTAVQYERNREERRRH